MNLEILESDLSNWISQNCFLLVWKHKQTIYIFLRLVKAFNEGAYSVKKHLKQIHHSKLNSVRIFKETIGWNHETSDCFGLTVKSTKPNTFQHFQKIVRVKHPDDSTKQQVVFHLVGKTLNFKKVLNHISFRFNKGVDHTILPRSHPNTTTTPEFHQTPWISILKSIWSHSINMKNTLFATISNVRRCNNYIFTTGMISVILGLISELDSQNCLCVLFGMVFLFLVWFLNWIPKFAFPMFMRAWLILIS